MITSNALKTVTLASVSAAAAAMFIQACGGGSSAQAVAVPGGATEADPLIGVWSSDSTLKDCASGAVTGTFKGYAMFNQGGTASFDNARPPSTHGSTMGTWKRGEDGVYTITLIFMRFNPDGTVAGTQKGRVKRTLSEDGATFTGTVTGDVIDLAGKVVSSYCAVDSGARVTW